MSISSSVLLSSISGLVISFPKNTIRWMLAGQSVPGVLCIACQIFFLSRQFDPRVTGIKHCTLTSTIITVTLVAFLIARRTVIKLQKSDFVLTSCFLSLLFRNISNFTAAFILWVQTQTNHGLDMCHILRTWP